MSPQGQWYFHRFGKRNFPNGEIDFIELLNFLKSNPQKQIICHCFFGDPLYYSNIIPLASYCKENNIDLMIFTYGTFDEVSTIDKLIELDVKFYLMISGFEDTNNLLNLYSDWQDIKYIINNTKSNNLFLEYSLFKHNFKDIIKLCKFLNNKGHLKIFHGNLLGSDHNCIIDNYGKWLYDFERSDYESDILNRFIDLSKENILSELERYKMLEKNLIKSSRGYLFLRTCIYDRNFSNIFGCNLPKLEGLDILDVEEDIFLNYLGYAFKNRDLYEIFNNSLCDDWYDYVKKNIESDDIRIFSTQILKLKELKKDPVQNKIHIHTTEKDIQERLDRHKIYYYLSFLANENLNDYKLSTQF